MLKETDIFAVREAAKKLFDVVEIKPYERFPFACCHPYTNSVMLPKEQGGIADLTKEEDYLVWRQSVFERIDRCGDVLDFLLILDKSWYLTFLKFSKEKMCLEDFSKALGEAWVIQENPNGDVNVPLRTSVSWFKKADKSKLMNKKDYRKWNSFDVGLVVYRGVAVGRKAKGLSWTTSREKADWFAHRYDNECATGYVEKLVVTDKSSILAYFSTRAEEEVVINTFVEKRIEIIDE